MSKITPQVMRLRDDENRHIPIIVFAKGRTLYHAIVADTTIKLDTLETLRGLAPMEYKGGEYPVKRAASFWLNHSTREITKRARAVLRSLVARKPKEEATT